jgi:leucyl-tRNA synthetase
MPGWAGSSWYFLRYMDPNNATEFVAKDKVKYWQNVDLYIGGAEHATGHLLYSRFWTKFLYDLSYIPFEEPFKKMINQGMIQGNSAYIDRGSDIEVIKKGGTSDPEVANITYPTIYVSKGMFENNPDEVNRQLKKIIIDASSKGDFSEIDFKLLSVTKNITVDINFVEGEVLNKEWIDKNSHAYFIKENDKFLVRREVEKMSKSKYNVQTPDDLVEKYGADTLRCYEMFLGPLEQHKPWDVQGITGVHGFLKKLWRLFHDEEAFNVCDDEPTKEELKSLHKTIKKVKEDIERFAFNTPVSTYMICVNELTALKCNKRAILSDLCIILSPYAPHIAEELWAKLGNTKSISNAVFPKHNEAYLTESNHKYPVSFNGKMRFMLELPANMSKEDIEAAVMANEQTTKYLDGKAPKKVIVVPKKIVNFVV